MTQITQQQALEAFDDLLAECSLHGVWPKEQIDTIRAFITQQAPAPLPSRDEVEAHLQAWGVQAPWTVAEAVLDLIHKTQERG